MKSYNRDIAADIMNKLPEGKLNALRNACTRNAILTGYYGLDSMTLTVYIEGFRIELNGVRSSFSVYAKDNDGEFEIVRKPAEDKLHKLYDTWDRTDNVVNLAELTER